MSELNELVVGALDEHLVGPMAEDFAEDICRDMGIKLEDISEGDLDEFADKVEEKGKEVAKDHKASFAANVVRKLG